MYNKKKVTDKPVGKSSGLNHSSSGKASEKHNFPKQNDSKKASDVCPVHKKCGGCQYQGMAYKKQLSLKQRQANMLLGKFGTVLPIIGMKNPLHYRNKVHAVFAFEKGKAIAGTYQEGTHKVVPVESCLIDDEKSDAIIQTIRELLRSFKIKTYNEDSGYGLLRHVLIRRGFTSGEIMVVLVASSPVFPSKNNFVKALRKEHPEITTVILNVNDQNTSMVLGERNITLYGKGYIVDTLCGHTFAISPSAFYQVNPVQTEILYQTAMDYAGLTGKETVVDAYCGIGTITLCLAKAAKRVIGAEIVPPAIRDAKENAVRNGIENAEFFCGDAADIAARLEAEGLRPDVVTVDPPRKGLAPEVVASVAAMRPEKVVYVSCDPATLGRDVKLFGQLGYQAVRAAAVDMFPGTAHVETVVLLSKGEVDSKKIRVEFSLEDMDMSEFQDGATYPQIKEYVLEHTGLKVSNLYISQIKRKCGIEVGKNYNLPKSEDSRQPQCPPEKEKAIREALKYYGMI